MSFYLTHKGSFKNLEKFISKMQKGDIFSELSKYGQQGVDALRMTTPVDSGLTSSSWYYVVNLDKDNTTIEWHNNNTNKGVNIAIILQFGHGTGTGGYVYGRDYINPAVQPVMEQIAHNVWTAVKNS